MPRTKGSRDKKPRQMNPASLATIASGIPGYVSVSVRVYAPANDARWFERMDSKERGEVVSKFRNTTHEL